MTKRAIEWIGWPNWIENDDSTPPFPPTGVVHNGIPVVFNGIQVVHGA